MRKLDYGKPRLQGKSQNMMLEIGGYDDVRAVFRRKLQRALVRARAAEARHAGNLSVPLHRPFVAVHRDALRAENVRYSLRQSLQQNGRHVVRPAVAADAQRLINRRDVFRWPQPCPRPLRR